MNKISLGDKVAFKLGSMEVVGRVVNFIHTQVYAKDVAGNPIKVDKDTVQAITMWGTLQEADLKDVKFLESAKPPQMTAEKENEEALRMIREVTDDALLDTPLVEAVAILISQRDNARDCSDVFKKRLQVYGANFL